MKTTKRLRLLLTVIFVVTIVALFFVGCVDPNIDKYSAVLYDMAQTYMKKEFLMQQPSYPHANPDTSNPSATTQESTFVVNDTNAFDEMFNDFPTTIDFNSEMLIVSIHINFYMGNGYEIKKLALKKGVLSLDLKRNANSVAHTASAPRQRCFVVKMKKCDLTSVSVTVSQ